MPVIWGFLYAFYFRKMYIYEWNMQLFCIKKHTVLCGALSLIFNLQLLPAFQRAEQRDLVGVFQVAAHRDAGGQAGDPNPQRL